MLSEIVCYFSTRLRLELLLRPLRRATWPASGRRTKITSCCDRRVRWRLFGCKARGAIAAPSRQLAMSSIIAFASAAQLSSSYCCRRFKATYSLPSPFSSPREQSNNLISRDKRRFKRRSHIFIRMHCHRRSMCTFHRLASDTLVQKQLRR